MTINPPFDVAALGELAAQVPADERPSIVADRRWLYAYGTDDGGPDGDGGKWLLYAPRDRIDGVWAAVRLLTQQGLLGPAAKVSTAYGRPDADDHVICAYVADWHDTATVRRVLANLREAGIGREWLNFKRDADTIAGFYKANGDHNVATFTAPPDEERIYTKRLGATTWLDGANDAEVVAAIEAGDDLTDEPTAGTRCGT